MTAKTARTAKNVSTAVAIVEAPKAPKQDNVKVIASAMNDLVNSPKADTVDCLSRIVGAYCDARPETVSTHELATETFVFSIGSVRPKLESWMEPFVQRIARMFGCVAYVGSVTRGIGSFEVCGRDNDARIASRICNAMIVRTHHDAWKSANGHKTDVPCATRRETFCNARLAMIDTIIELVVTSPEVVAYASTMRATNATQSA